MKRKYLVIELVIPIARPLQSIPKSPFYRILDYVESLGIQRDVLYLNQGVPHFDTPKHIKEAAKKALDEGFTKYTPEAGILELREAIAEKLKRENGLDADPKTEIFVTSGGQAGVYSSLGTLLNPGDEVLIPSPYYPIYYIHTLLLGCRPVTVPFKLGRELTLDPETLEKHITTKTKAIFVHTPNNPSAGVMLRKNIQAIAEVALKHNLTVISDEVYEKILFDNAEHVSIASLPEMKKRTVSIFSFSKTYSMTGWRVGYIVAGEEFIRNLLKVHHAINICCTSISQKAALAALQGPHNFLKVWQRKYEDNRREVMEGLKKCPMLELAVEPKGTFYVFINVEKLKMNSEEATRFFAREAKVVLTPGSGFGEEGEGHIRMSFAADINSVTRALKNMAEAVEGYRYK